MFSIVLLSTALAGSPGIFKKTSFFAKPDSLTSNSLESRINRLERIEGDFKLFTNEFLEWGKSYHLFKIQTEKEILSDILSHTGQGDFLKELEKCGFTNTFEAEDMGTVKMICYDKETAKRFVAILIQELREKAETCVNVKEKYKKRINDAYDDFFYSDIEEELEKSDINTDVIIADTSLDNNDSSEDDNFKYEHIDISISNHIFDKTRFD